jgi:hypothetical protein
MRAHIIKDGVVANTIEVESLDFMPGLIDASNGGSVGDSWDGATFTKPAPPVPQVVSPRQFRQALTHYGFRANVESAMTSADQDTKDWYEFATSFERSHPKVLSMARALGYTVEQVDAVWSYGAKL